MRRLLLHAISISVLAAVTAVPATAAPVGGQVITDCNSHARLTRQYSVPQLRGALAAMPADVKEYTDCYDVIQRALIAQLGAAHHGGGSGSSGGSGGSFLPTPLIVLIVLLGLGTAAFVALSARRRGRADRAGGP